MGIAATASPDLKKAFRGVEPLKLLLLLRNASPRCRFRLVHAHSLRTRGARIRLLHALYKTAQAFGFSVSHKHKIAPRGRYTERRKTYIALNKFTGSRSTNLCACTSDGLGFQRDKPAQWFSPFDNYQNGASCRFTKFIVSNKCTQI